MNYRTRWIITKLHRKMRTIVERIILMKLSSNFLTHQMNGEQLLVPIGNTGFNGIARSNDTAAFIIEQLKTDTTEERIVEAMLNVYDAEKEFIERDVRSVVEKLRSIGAIED